MNLWLLLSHYTDCINCSTHWLIWLHNHFKLMQSLVESASNSWKFYYEKVRNTLFITFKSIQDTLRLILKKRGNNCRGLIINLWYFLYFHVPWVKQGVNVKTSQKLQGTVISRFGALKFSQKWTNFEKLLQNWGFGLEFRRFWRFFNFVLTPCLTPGVWK